MKNVQQQHFVTENSVVPYNPKNHTGTVCASSEYLEQKTC